LLVLLLPPAASAQQGATLSGRILDTASRTPIALTEVVIERAQSGDTVSATVARQDGRFVVVGLAPGRYTVRTSFPGFFPEQRDLVVSEVNPSYDLGDILLRNVGALAGITVAVDAVRTAGIDTQVFRLDQGASQATGSVLDALKNLPGLTVDEEGRVSLRGSDQVAILIDGRQSSLTGFGSQRGLENVPAANIAAIEIINNPSASLDATGMAGVINIIYKQERSLGFSGEVGLSVGVGQFTRQRADLPPSGPTTSQAPVGSFTTNEKIAPALSLNYNTAGVRTFLHAEYLTQHDLPNNEFHTRYYDDGRVVQSQVPENRKQTHYIFRAGADLLRGGGNTITLSAIYDVEDHTDRAQVPYILETGQRDRLWFWREQEQTGLANGALEWKHAFPTPGHELDVNLQFSKAWEDEQYWLNEESSVRVGTDMTHLKANEYTLPLSIDYTRPLASGRVELGGKLQTRWLPIGYETERGTRSVIYPGLGDSSDWGEDLFAGYVNLVRAKESYTVEAGVRAEQTNVEYSIPQENIYYPSSDAYDYFELFPNVKLTRTLGGGYRVVAAYNRRINRPGEPELRIFAKYDDPELLKVGNPYLRPQLTNVFELGVARSWTGGSVSTAAYHRDITDAFKRIFAIDSSNPNYDVVNKIYHNVGKSRQTGVQVLFEQDIAAPWRVSGSVNWLVVDIDAFETTLLFPQRRQFALAASSDATWDFNVSNQVELPGAGDLRLGYIYYAARDVPQGRERARSALDLAATWPLMDERAEVNFTFTDIFNDFAVRTDIVGQGFTALYENLLETQVATVAVRLRF
jgi:outer membrane receptor protein involved in Fe transport